MKRDMHKGFTLLLSILVISMVLSVALGITSITLKELQLATIMRESESAFHAADKGIDCALFYHISYDRNIPALLWSPFPTSTVQPSTYDYPQNYLTATCNGIQLVNFANTGWTVSPTNASAATTTFRLLFGGSEDAPCAYVTIGNSNNGVDSRIVSEGYNTCEVTSPRRTLRVIEVSTNL
jgi:hypothetical protein